MAEKPKAEDSSGLGCWAHLAGIVLLIALKGGLKGMNQWLPNIGVDGWLLLELIVLAAFGVGYALWFAAAKIRHRDKLGATAAALGGAELLILVVHTGMLAAMFYLLFTAAAANPQLAEDDIDALLKPWILRASLVSTACHAAWALLTATLFMSLWLRPQRDWPADFIQPAARPA